MTPTGPAARSAQSLSQWNLRRNPLPHLRRLQGGALLGWCPPWVVPSLGGAIQKAKKRCFLKSNYGCKKQ